MCFRTPFLQRSMCKQRDLLVPSPSPTPPEREEGPSEKERRSGERNEGTTEEVEKVCV